MQLELTNEVSQELCRLIQKEVNSISGLDSREHAEKFATLYNTCFYQLGFGWKVIVALYHNKYSLYVR